MPTALLIPILLRLAGPIAFTGATLAAGAMNRSFMLVPLLALAASLTTVIIRMVSPFPVTDIQSMLNPDAAPQKPNPYQGMGRRLIIGLVGYSVAFGLAALIAAMFQTTEFEPALMLSDAGYLIVPALIAILGAFLSARLGAAQMAGMMGQMQDLFAQMQDAQNGQPSEDDAFTVDGEIIDPDEDRSDS